MDLHMVMAGPMMRQSDVDKIQIKRYVRHEEMRWKGVIRMPSYPGGPAEGGGQACNGAVRCGGPTDKGMGDLQKVAERDNRWTCRKW